MNHLVTKLIDTYADPYVHSGYSQPRVNLLKGRVNLENLRLKPEFFARLEEAFTANDAQMFPHGVEIREGIFKEVKITFPVSDWFNGRWKIEVKGVELSGITCSEDQKKRLQKKAKATAIKCEHERRERDKNKEREPSVDENSAANPEVVEDNSLAAKIDRHMRKHLDIVFEDIQATLRLHTETENKVEFDPVWRTTVRRLEVDIGAGELTLDEVLRKVFEKSCDPTMVPMPVNPSTMIVEEKTKVSFFGIHFEVCDLAKKDRESEDYEEPAFSFDFEKTGFILHIHKKTWDQVDTDPSKPGASQFINCVLPDAFSVSVRWNERLIRMMIGTLHEIFDAVESAIPDFQDFREVPGKLDGRKVVAKQAAEYYQLVRKQWHLEHGAPIFDDKSAPQFLYCLAPVVPVQVTDPEPEPCVHTHLSSAELETIEMMERRLPVEVIADIKDRVIASLNAPEWETPYQCAVDQIVPSYRWFWSAWQYYAVSLHMSSSFEVTIQDTATLNFLPNMRLELVRNMPGDWDIHASMSMQCMSTLTEERLVLVNNLETSLSWRRSTSVPVRLALKACVPCFTIIPGSMESIHNAMLMLLDVRPWEWSELGSIWREFGSIHRSFDYALDIKLEGLRVQVPSMDFCFRIDAPQIETPTSWRFHKNRLKGALKIRTSFTRAFFTMADCELDLLSYSKFALDVRCDDMFTVKMATDRVSLTIFPLMTASQLRRMVTLRRFLDEYLFRMKKMIPKERLRKLAAINFWPFKIEVFMPLRVDLCDALSPYLRLNVNNNITFHGYYCAKSFRVNYEFKITDCGFEVEYIDDATGRFEPFLEETIVNLDVSLAPPPVSELKVKLYFTEIVNVNITAAFIRVAQSLDVAWGPFTKSMLQRSTEPLNEIPNGNIAILNLCSKTVLASRKTQLSNEAEATVKLQSIFRGLKSRTKSGGLPSRKRALTHPVTIDVDQESLGSFSGVVQPSPARSQSSVNSISQSRPFNWKRELNGNGHHTNTNTNGGTRPQEMERAEANQGILNSSAGSGKVSPLGGGGTGAAGLPNPGPSLGCPSPNPLLMTTMRREERETPHSVHSATNNMNSLFPGTPVTPSPFASIKKGHTPRWLKQTPLLKVGSSNDMDGIYPIPSSGELQPLLIVPTQHLKLDFRRVTRNFGAPEFMTLGAELMAMWSPENSISPDTSPSSQRYSKDHNREKDKSFLERVIRTSPRKKGSSGNMINMIQQPRHVEPPSPFSNQQTQESSMQQDDNSGSKFRGFAAKYKKHSKTTGMSRVFHKLAKVPTHTKLFSGRNWDDKVGWHGGRKNEGCDDREIPLMVEEPRDVEHASFCVVNPFSRMVAHISTEDTFGGTTSNNEAAGRGGEQQQRGEQQGSGALTSMTSKQQQQQQQLSTAYIIETIVPCVTDRLIVIRGPICVFNGTTLNLSLHTKGGDFVCSNFAFLGDDCPFDASVYDLPPFSPTHEFSPGAFASLQPQDRDAQTKTVSIALGYGHNGPVPISSLQRELVELSPKHFVWSNVVKRVTPSFIAYDIILTPLLVLRNTTPLSLEVRIGSWSDVIPSNVTYHMYERVPADKKIHLRFEGWEWSEGIPWATLASKDEEDTIPLRTPSRDVSSSTNNSSQHTSNKGSYNNLGDENNNNNNNKDTNSSRKYNKDNNWVSHMQYTWKNKKYAARVLVVVHQRGAVVVFGCPSWATLQRTDLSLGDHVEIVDSDGRMYPKLSRELHPEECGGSRHHTNTDFGDGDLLHDDIFSSAASVCGAEHLDRNITNVWLLDGTTNNKIKFHSWDSRVRMIQQYWKSKKKQQQKVLYGCMGVGPGRRNSKRNSSTHNYKEHGEDDDKEERGFGPAPVAAPGLGAHVRAMKRESPPPEHMCVLPIAKAMLAPQQIALQGKLYGFSYFPFVVSSRDMPRWAGSSGGSVEATMTLIQPGIQITNCLDTEVFYKQVNETNVLEAKGCAAVAPLSTKALWLWANHRRVSFGDGERWSSPLTLENYTKTSAGHYSFAIALGEEEPLVWGAEVSDDSEGVLSVLFKSDPMLEVSVSESVADVIRTITCLTDENQDGVRACFTRRVRPRENTRFPVGFFNPFEARARAHFMTLVLELPTGDVSVRVELSSHKIYCLLQPQHDMDDDSHDTDDDVVDFARSPTSMRKPKDPRQLLCIRILRKSGGLLIVDVCTLLYGIDLDVWSRNEVQLICTMCGAFQKISDPTTHTHTHTHRNSSPDVNRQSNSLSHQMLGAPRGSVGGATSPSSNRRTLFSSRHSGSTGEELLDPDKHKRASGSINFTSSVNHEPHTLECRKPGCKSHLRLPVSSRSMRYFAQKIHCGVKELRKQMNAQAARTYDPFSATLNMNQWVETLCVEANVHVPELGISVVSTEQKRELLYAHVGNVRCDVETPSGVGNNQRALISLGSLRVDSQLRESQHHCALASIPFGGQSGRDKGGAAYEIDIHRVHVSAPGIHFRHILVTARHRLELCLDEVIISSVTAFAHEVERGLRAKASKLGERKLSPEEEALNTMPAFQPTPVPLILSMQEVKLTSVNCTVWASLRLDRMSFVPTYAIKLTRMFTLWDVALSLKSCLIKIQEQKVKTWEGSVRALGSMILGKYNPSFVRIGLILLSRSNVFNFGKSPYKAARWAWTKMADATVKVIDISTGKTTTKKVKGPSFMDAPPLRHPRILMANHQLVPYGFYFPPELLEFQHALRDAEAKILDEIISCYNISSTISMIVSELHAGFVDLNKRRCTNRVLGYFPWDELQRVTFNEDVFCNEICILHVNGQTYRWALELLPTHKLNILKSTVNRKMRLK